MQNTFLTFSVLLLESDEKIGALSGVQLTEANMSRGKRSRLICSTIRVVKACYCSSGTNLSPRYKGSIRGSYHPL